MKTFSFHRKSVPLRSLIRMSNVSTVVIVAVIIALGVFLPSPWNWIVLVVGLGLNLVALVVFVKAMKKRHTLDSEQLCLSYGQFGVALPLTNLAEASSFGGQLPDGLQIAKLVADHSGEQDTLYLLSDSQRLVELSLKEPTHAEVPGKGLSEFTKVVLSLDEPEDFLAALKAEGV